jgi:hypothetical protein
MMLLFLFELLLPACVFRVTDLKDRDYVLVSLVRDRCLPFREIMHQKSIIGKLFQCFIIHIQPQLCVQSVLQPSMPRF